MIDPIDRAVRTIARRNPYALVWAQFGITHLVVLGRIVLLEPYHPLSSTNLRVLIGVSQALVSIDNLIAIKLTRRLWRPVTARAALRSRLLAKAAAINVITAVVVVAGLSTQGHHANLRAATACWGCSEPPS